MSYIKFVAFCVCWMSLSAVCFGQDAAKLVQKQLSTGEDLVEEQSFDIIKDHVSSTSGVHHVYFQQAVDGIPIHGTESSLHWDKNGALILSQDAFFRNIKTPPSPASKTALPAEICVQNALYSINMDAQSLRVKRRSKNLKQETKMEIATMPNRSINARLGYELGVDDALTLCWSFAILDQENSNYWMFRVDAITGKVISKEDVVSQCDYIAPSNDEMLDYNANLFDMPNYKLEETSELTCENCYEVIPFPFVSPYFTPRIAVIENEHPVASPYGWHDTDGVAGAEETTTEGNNVIAFEAFDRYGFQPDGGTTLDFSGYDFDPVYSTENQYENAAITNLFYWNNIAHDILYVYGFTEATGNFQMNNYGRGGVGGDPVEAFGQSETQECNALFGAVEDGEPPFMKINTCGDKDGDFDNTVLLHEYGHGIISRLRVGSIGGSCNGGNNENPKEGWCDWFAAFLTISPEDVGETPRPIAAYLRNQGPTGQGIRNHPYSTDTSVNPEDYSTLRENMGRHAVGAVWAEILWEMTWSLIDYFGFDPNLHNFTGDINQDAGNIMALAVVVEGLKLTPCTVGFEVARDGIVLAANLIYGPDVSCLLWESFARRGMGYGARQGSPNLLTDQIVSYSDNFEALFELQLEGICETSSSFNGLTGGNPVGGVYSGPGVTDDGNGRTFTFDPMVAGIGEHELTYAILESPCYEAEEVSVYVSVIPDSIPPVIYCYDDLEIVNVDDERFEIPDFSQLILVEDNCSDVTTYSQTPAAGAMLKEGLVEMLITVTDEADNVTTCEFRIEISHVVENPVLLFTSLEVFPNPFEQTIQLSNPLKTAIKNFQIRDLHGRLINDTPLADSSPKIPIDMQNLSSGIYFMKVYYRNLEKTFKIIKE